MTSVTSASGVPSERTIPKQEFASSQSAYATRRTSYFATVLPSTSLLVPLSPVRV